MSLLTFNNQRQTQNESPMDQLKNPSIIFKGWILTYQDLFNNTAGDLGGYSTSGDYLKWVPKFVVVSKFDKCVLMYDHEPSNQVIMNNFQSICISNPVDQLEGNLTSDKLTYRLDSSVNQDVFVNYWKNRLSKFDLNLIDTNSKSDENYMLNNCTFSNHHLSNKDIELLDKSDTLNKTSITESAQTTANGTFRFAGLFFKKDKAEKLKHSSLKRAKSGIQLERKKPTGMNANSTILIDTKSSKLNMTTVNNQSVNVDYENRHSLPSPMRPSRSHESLSSPLKPSITINSNIDQNELKKSSHFNRINQFLASNRSKQTSQTPSHKSKQNNDSINNLGHFQLVDNLIKLNLNSNTLNQEASSPTKPQHFSTPQVQINSIHSSIFNAANCFEIKCITSTIRIINPTNKTRILEKSDSSEQDELNCEDENEEENYQYSNSRESRRLKPAKNENQFNPKLKYHFSSQSLSSRYFMCRSFEERDKWIQCLREVAEPNLVAQRHDENSLQVWILEAKGQTISSKPNKKYFCEIFLNNNLSARSCSKDKKDILFWGEIFDFSHIHCDNIRVELYQQITETQKKKIRKDKDPSSQSLIGFVNIPLSSIESSQPTEKWYKLEPPSTNPNFANEPDQTQPCTQTNSSSASLTTTQNFSKDSTSIRIKAKYLCVDILPLSCYQRLIEFIRSKYLNLIILEPHLNVRIKDDLANSLVRIAHNLQIQTKFLTDLVLAEVLQLEDDSLTFRGNSLATKAMESYMKLVGENYLKQTLSDCVRSIIETNHDLEIDPSKVTNQSNLQANREELVQILHLVCGRVFNSCINIPIEMKHVFSCLRTECKRNGRTDEMCDMLISASIFLRFICPAILSPNLFNLTQEYPQEKAARKLTLAAKTLQTIANFSKFGGKEFYMSFEKMNQFVDEHKILMREFLRNISTWTDEDELEMSEINSRRDSSANLVKQILPILTLTPQTPEPRSRSNRNESVLLNPNLSENDFDVELTDIGKQLSILHTLLTSILSGLDEGTRSKFDPDLTDILSEISYLKKSPMLINDLGQGQPQANKLYSYENRLHFALMKNQQNSSPVTPSTPSSANSSSEINQPSVGQESSSASSSRYSSHVTLNIVNNSNERNSSIEMIDPVQQQQLEFEVNLLKQRLKETELSLKKEQTEKYLIEFKLKQQQQDNDQQMRNIINRLIKVEEELRKEQSEMHKLLKAKQDLIEIQKKRIEYLSNRSLSAHSSSHKSTQYPNSHQILSILPQNHPSTNYNQHVYQPKLRQHNKTHSKASSLNENTNGATSQPVPIQSSQNPSLKVNEKAAQIAASPSSSSSSMTQFCTYQVANSKLNQNSSQSSINKLGKLSMKGSLALDKQGSVSASSSSNSSNASTLNNQNHVNSQMSANFLRASEL